MTSRKWLTYTFSAAVVAVAALSAGAAYAQRGYSHGRWWYRPGPYVHIDIRPWYHGYWWHGPRFGRVGWWWVVGGVWYFYPAPVYPYPDPYLPPTMVVPQASAPAAPAGPPPEQYWYYCKSAKTYYPYVASCPEGWQKVPATPPAPAATTPP